MGWLCQEQEQVLELSSCLLKVDHLGKIKLEEGSGQKESRKTSESKMKRFKDRVRVGEESREAGGEAHSTEKREQRRQIMICLSTYPETEAFLREGQAVPWGTALGRVSCSGCSMCSASPGKPPLEVQKLCMKLLHLLTISLTAESV